MQRLLSVAGALDLLRAAGFEEGDGAEELPAGRTRVARVHLEIRGPEPLESRVRLLVAGGPGGEPITAAASAVAGGL